jgi:acetolactate synthase-1/2/3 large subunit
MMRAAFEAADLVILIGFDLMEFEPQYWNIGAVKKIVYIATAPCDSVPGFAPDVQIVGNLGRSLRALGQADGRRSNWAAELRADLVDKLNEVPEESKGVKPQAIVRAIRSALGREDIAVSDVGAHLIWMAQRYPVYHENTLLMSNGLIPMGVGIPWAIAAKLAHPDRKVVASVGDGSFLMSSMELETAKRLGTPFVTVVWNDSELGLIRIKQEKAFGRSHGIEFANPDLIKYAESLGASGYRASSICELEKILARSIRDDELAVIDVIVDREETARLTPS